MTSSMVSDNTKGIASELAPFGLSLTHPHLVVDCAPAALVEQALTRYEGTLSSTGALCVKTGAYTGRSPEDRFIVDTPDVHDNIAWGTVNKPFAPKDFERIKDAIVAYLNDRDEVFVEHCLSGALPTHSRKFLLVCERASQALFAHQLLVRPENLHSGAFGEADFALLAAPGLSLDAEKFHTHSEAVVLINFQQHIILIAGTGYNGEIKKSIFSVMNYLLPVEDGVLPMHSSCNVDPQNGSTAVFFGLSGTGKTTLSADPRRLLVGDDEHGWSDQGVFNLEGGCYAKSIRISAESEPEIFQAIRFGAVAENVVIDPVTRVADYFDAKYTENTRVAYPINYIPNARVCGYGGTPEVVIFLTADAFGVLPPLARLTIKAAMYQFVSGFTSKVAGTEWGITEPVPTFSSLFGEPFMPLDPLRYADMFGKRMQSAKTRVYLVNTGWTGGPYGVGERIKLGYTRKMVNAALDGSVERSQGFRHDSTFNVDVPVAIDGVPSELLDPKATWKDAQAYDRQAARLAEMFIKNQQQRFPNMDPDIIAAGPQLN